MELIHITLTLEVEKFLKNLNMFLYLLTSLNLTIQFYWMLPRTEVLLWWPLVFVPLLVSLFLAYVVSGRLQQAIDARFEDFDARAIAPAGIGESQTQPT